jgi:hypothetical protein
MCSVNYRGKGYLVTWQRRGMGHYTVKATSPAIPAAVTGMDASPLDTTAGICTSEGQVYVVDYARMALIHRNRKAHMVFGTDMVYSCDGKACLSVSGDASARITIIPVRSTLGALASALSRIFILILIIVIVLVSSGNAHLLTDTVEQLGRLVRSSS